MERILVVEDDIEIAELLKRTLEPLYEVYFAYSGTEALYKLQEQSYHLILLDLMLPGLRGEELLLQIREKSNVPLIVLTAIENRQSVVEQLYNGANDYVTKPFHLDELKARIAVQLRDATSEVVEEARFKNLRLDLAAQIAYIQEQAVH